MPSAADAGLFTTTATATEAYANTKNPAKKGVNRLSWPFTAASPSFLFRRIKIVAAEVHI